MRAEGTHATPAGERIAAMDVLRGLALLGIFVVNLPVLASTSDLAYTPQPGEPAADAAAWWVVRVLATTKFFALFSLLFGMGLVLQMQRAERAGRPFAALARRRLATLAAMGLAHGVLLFVGDILFVYSLAGSVLFLARRADARRLLATAAVPFVFGVLLSCAVIPRLPLADAPADGGPVWAADENIRFADLADADDGVWPAFERKGYAEGPLRSTLLVNAVGYLGWLAMSTAFSFNWKVLAYFFAGAALMKVRFFDRSRRGWHAWLAAVGLPAGLALEALSAWGTWRAGAGAPSLATVLASEVGSTVLAGGYLGAVTLLVARGAFAPLQRGLAAAGRLALTNYIAQSAVACLVFRWYGFDQYGAWSRAALLAFAVALFAVQVAASRAWLARFRAGPLERLWRRATYGA